MQRKEVSAKDGRNLNDVIQIDEAQVKQYFGEVVRGPMEEAINTLLDAYTADCPRRPAAPAAPSAWASRLAPDRQYRQPTHNQTLIIPGT